MAKINIASYFIWEELNTEYKTQIKCMHKSNHLQSIKIWTLNTVNG